MSNSLYYQWLAAIAERDQAMLFIALTALTGIGIWLGLRGWTRARKPFVYIMVGLYYATLILILAVYLNR
jgi:hypothetical protein